MHTTQNEVVIHLDEDVDETTLRGWKKESVMTGELFR
jgi:hypothetical protein